jgi:hypothetical protein
VHPYAERLAPLSVAQLALTDAEGLALTDAEGLALSEAEGSRGAALLLPCSIPYAPAYNLITNLQLLLCVSDEVQIPQFYSL